MEVFRLISQYWPSTREPHLFVKHRDVSCLALLLTSILITKVNTTRVQIRVCMFNRSLSQIFSTSGDSGKSTYHPI